MTVTYVDLDGTLVRGSAAFAFARVLRDLAPVGKSDVARFATGQLRMTISGKEPNVGGLAERALLLLQGLDVTNLKYELAERGLVVMHKIEHGGSQKLVQAERGRGHTVVLATAAPEPIAEVARRWFSFDDHLSTQLGVSEDGKLDGTLVNGLCHGEGKAAAVAAHALANGIDLSKARALSDSCNDLPMLELVGHPIAVNPDSKLRSVAKARGWEVIDLVPARGKRRIVRGSFAIAGCAVGVLLVRKALTR